MGNIKQLIRYLYESLQRYFHHLSNTGYRKQADVDKLLVLIMIQELLGEKFRCFVTEEDFKIINKVLYCLFGSSCMFPYPHKKSNYIGSHCSS